MEYVTLEWFYNNYRRLLSEKTESTHCAVYDRTEVNYGTEEDCDTQWCAENGIPCYNIERSAGCCANAEGSINIADIHRQNGVFLETKFLPDFADWLKSKGLSVELVHNDVLVNGKKVSSAGGFNIPPNFDWQYTCVQISINQDLFVIEHACKKKMTKTPGGLSEYGISTEDVLQFCEKWFSENWEKEKTK